MFHSPLGAVSLFFNILIICIGLISRFLNRHSIQIRNATKVFLNSFIDAENDTMARRIFAGSIPLTMFLTITAGIVFAFFALLKDERRMPFYTVPLSAYGYIANTKEGQWVISSLYEIHAWTPAVILGSNKHDITNDVTIDLSLIPVALPTATTTTSTTTSRDEGMFNVTSSTAKSGSSLDTYSVGLHRMIATRSELLSQNTLVILGTSSKSLTELLKANNIDNSRDNKAKLANLLGLADYRGSDAEDSLILKKLQDIQKYNYSYNR